MDDLHEHEDWLLAAQICLRNGYYKEAAMLIDKVWRECTVSCREEEDEKD